MPFPKTASVPIQFMGGLNSKISEFTLDQPYLTTCKNGVYNQAGQIDKRTGFKALSTNIQGGGNISSGAALTTFNGELLLLDGRSIYSYQNEEDVWISRGAVYSTVNDQVRVLNSIVSTQSNPDMTTANDISVYVWEDNRSFPPQGDGIRYSVYNNSTGTIVLSDQQLYIAAVRPKVITDGVNFFIYYCASAQNILSATIPVAAPNTVTTNLVQVTIDGLSSNFPVASVPYDVCMYLGVPLICYAGQTGLRLGYPSGYHQILNGNTQIQTVSMCVDSNNIVWIVYSDKTNTYVSAWGGPNSWYPQFSAFPVNPLEPVVSVNIGICSDLQRGNINMTLEVAQAGASNVNNNFCDNYTVTPKGVATFIGQMRGVGLASKPFKFNNDVFINTVAQSNLQSTYFTQCLTQGLGYVPGTANIQAANNTELATNFALVAKHSPQNGGNYRTNSLLAQCDPVTPTTYGFAGQRKGPFSTWENATQVNLGCAGYTIAFGDSNNFNNVSANNNLHIVGGIKKIYDGVSCVEDNFVLFPEDYLGNGCEVALQSFPIGQLVYSSQVSSQYQWCVVYEWIDNFGQKQRSTPSIAVTATTSQGSQSALLTGPTLRITEKIQARSPAIISIYRTQANLPIFYKVTNDVQPLVNDPTVDTWTFVDTLSDTQIASNENLYTGSQLANTAPPPSSLISLYQQRLMINSTEDPGVLWYSQNKFEQDQYNTLALDWNTSFVEGVDSRYGNEITAIGLIDNNLAIFKETSIFLLQGDGPNPLNTAGDFNDAQLLVSDTGCTNQNSLVFVTQTPSLPGGLLFKSAKGIYLLGRDQSISYIGAPVEKYNDLTITSASLLAQTNQIVFGTLEGTALVYNYFFNAWSTWGDIPSVSGTVWNKQLCLLTASGTVLMQDITGTVFVDTFSENVTYPVKLDIETPFIKMSGMQGYQSVFACTLLGTLQDTHTLQVTVSYDYNDSAEGSVLIDSTLASAGRWGGNPVWGSQGVWGNQGQFSNYQYQINVNNPRCQSIKFRFTDVQPTPSQAFSLNGLVLEVLALPGAFRVPQGNKVALR